MGSLAERNRKRLVLFGVGVALLGVGILWRSGVFSSPPSPVSDAPLKSAVEHAPSPVGSAPAKLPIVGGPIKQPIADDPSKSAAVEDTPLEIKLYGVRHGASDEIFNSRGEKIDERPMLETQSTWRPDVQPLEFLIEIPQGMDRFIFDQARVYYSGSDEQLRGGKSSRDVLYGDRVLLGCTILSPMTSKGLPIESVDLDLSYFYGDCSESTHQFEGPFSVDEVRRSEDGKVVLEILGTKDRLFAFKIRASLQPAIDEGLVVMDDLEGNRHFSRYQSSGSTNEWKVVVPLASLRHMARISVFEPPRKHRFRNIHVGHLLRHETRWAPWAEEMARRVGQINVTSALARRGFKGKLSEALELIDVVREASALSAWTVIREESSRRFEDFKSDEQERLRVAIRRWETMGDIQFRLMALDLGLRFGWSDAFDGALDVLEQVQGNALPWGLGRTACDDWVGLGRTGSYRPMLQPVAQSLGRFSSELSSQQEERLYAAFAQFDDSRIIESVLPLLLRRFDTPRGRQLLLTLAGSDNARAWWPILSEIHGRLTQEEVDKLPRGIQARLMLTKKGPLPTDAGKHQKDACTVSLEMWRQAASFREPSHSFPFAAILDHADSDCDRETMTEAMVGYLGGRIHDERDGPVVRRVVEQLNRWHGLGLGRIGAKVGSSQPTYGVVDWHALAGDVVLWHRTGRDPLEIPEGYRPGANDLRIVLKNTRDPEMSWIDTWRKPAADDPLRHHLIGGDNTPVIYFWIRPETEGENSHYRAMIRQNETRPPNPFTFKAEDLPMEINAIAGAPVDEAPKTGASFWQLWLENATSPDSVVSNTEILRKWQQDPRLGFKRSK